MRPPPGLTQLPRFPVIGGVSLLAIAVTVAGTAGRSFSALAQSPLMMHGQPWRLLTSALPHVGAFHLMFNVYWMWVFGTLIEDVFGHVWTLAIIALLAAGSGAAEYAVLAGGVGLSGVGYGLFGMLWVLSKKDARFADAVDRNTVVTFIAWFFFCIALTVSGAMPIGNIAHGAGWVMGMLLGLAIASRKGRIGYAAALVVLTVAAITGATVGRRYVNFSAARGEDEAGLGYDSLVAGQYDEAIYWYRHAVALNANQASWWYNLGLSYEDSKRYAEAFPCYERAVSLPHDDQNFNGSLERVRPFTQPSHR
jgi:membrane associated rhomboid family serine protease